MSNRDLTVGQLRAMTSHLPDEAPVEVMLSGLLTYSDETGSSPNIDGVLALGCKDHLSIEVSIVSDERFEEEGEDEEVVDARNNHGQGSDPGDDPDNVGY